MIVLEFQINGTARVVGIFENYKLEMKKYLQSQQQSEEEVE